MYLPKDNPVLCCSGSEYRLLIPHDSLQTSQRLKVIPRLTDALFAVLDCAGRTVADARHAVGAVLAPNRRTVFDCNVVHRTALRALPAADAGVRYGKGVRFDEEFVENRIDRAAHEAVVEVVPRRRKRLIGLNRCDCAVNVRFGLSDDLRAASACGAENIAM